MKHKLLALGLLVFGFAANSFAQETASATSSATVIQPITITKNVDMNFGNISLQAGATGTVVLNPTTGLRSTTGGITLPVTNGTVTAASFGITGANGYAFGFTLPTSVLLTIAGGGSTMTANNFTSNLAGAGSGSSTLSNTGVATLIVGATLNVTAAQTAGTYISPAFDVTVNYN
jgi:hypothetical protein